ncbi:Acg family FMN-binding oxidoreductase [Nocardiopsis sediminis]|uniref:Acg family FMN-binding oxidoreductase n=1 Tax=Nocardiopsis sediminis TaxID=1778267 RepID=A0ABV8FN70_9ACTN
MARPEDASTTTELLHDAKRAGERAPSVHNTRPWVVSSGDGAITISGDVDRALSVADPSARELIISCGAALYNIRVAFRAHGLLPDVAELPDPDRPGLLAEVTPAATAEPSEVEQALYEAIDRRRTHRGPFEADLDDSLLDDLGAAAAAESAALRTVTDDRLIHSLAGLVTAAEYLHRYDSEAAEELSHWVRSPDGRRPGGIRAEDVPATSADEERLFPGRDYRADIAGRLDTHGTATGTVAILETQADTRRSRLDAGQALERVLLTATSRGAGAAFHTQPLEEPGLRSIIAERFCDGAHPQMIMRLGRL